MKSSKKIILEAVSIYFDISQAMIISLNRKAELAKARHFYFYLCRELTRDSLSSMSNYIGRDHSTALHSIKKIKSFMSVYPDIKQEIKEVKKLITEMNPIIVSNVDLLQLTINYTNTKTYL